MPKTASKRGKPKPRPKKPKPLMVRTSERSAFKRCRWQWDQSFNARIKPRLESAPLRFGSLIHAALEKRYPKGIKRGPKPAQTFEKLYHEELKSVERDWGFRDSDGEWGKALEIGVSMMEMYVDEYGRDEDWEVLASEMTFQVPVYSPEHPSGEGFMQMVSPEPTAKRHIWFYYVGTMDGVWKNRMDGGVRIQDYKTTSGDPSKEAAKKSTLDEQATGYWTWGVDYLIEKKLIKPRDIQALDGMLYTFLRKAKKDERKQNSDGHYLNLDGSVSKQQPAPYFDRSLIYRSEAERENARQRALQEVREMALVRAGRLPVYKSPGLGYPDQQCQACGYFDMCELHENGADWESMRDATMAPWDPYDAHEIEQEGKR